MKWPYIVAAFPISGLALFLLWRALVAMRRDQLLRSLVWTSAAMVWVLGWVRVAFDLMERLPRHG